MTHLCRAGLSAVSAAVLAAATLAFSAHAAVVVTPAHGEGGPGFDLEPPPALNDAATTVEFLVVDGVPDPNGGGVAVLHDGRVPTGEDRPRENFFFGPGQPGGRLRIDLGRLIAVKQVNTYSWHAGERGPQVYRLYGADGGAVGFEARPGKDVDPVAHGWTLVARVDTRPKDEVGGGQHAVSITDPSGPLGRFRYLLLEVAPTESRDPFGNTFYSEIDVVDADGPALVHPARTTPAVAPIRRTFTSADGVHQFTLDATVAPDLVAWGEQELQPVVREWYPRIVALLSSDGHRAPTHVTLRFRHDMGGVPASASGASVHLNSQWFRGELQREARGAVVHELVHVVQDYGRVRRVRADARPVPGWIVEGIPDYIRWFLYEPQTQGAEVRDPEARFDASYRVSANFLDWVFRTRGSGVLRQLNAAAREGRYSADAWVTWTGSTVEVLGSEWRGANAQRLRESKAGAGQP